MTGDLRLFNRQKTRRVNSRLLRQIILAFLKEFPDAGDFDLSIHLIDAVEMTRLNETHLRHKGSTDVITFDHSEPNQPMIGEIYICVDEALIQSARFGIQWTEEAVRYVIHGVLHLRGYDDLESATRRRMKSAEDQFVRNLAERFDLSKLAGTAKLRA